ncbi:CAMKK protein kinase [Pseudogymnoascus sp. 24MN13]|nr:CAMKK protein kinase [Pseudogymnoascus sp. 24MN13]
MSSPGLYSPAQSSSPSRLYPATSSGTAAGSPFLHPLQMHKVRETHKAAIEQDYITGRQLINQYEILGEIGRGMHGKVKLARNIETEEKTMTKREIAILKKIRHPDIVGLYEVIDDPDYKKIYMILEYVELGEIKWRRKGTSQICAFERRRIERELRCEEDGGDEERLFKMLERRRIRKDAQRAKLANQTHSADFWSLEHGDDEDEFGDVTPLSRVPTHESLFIPRSFQSHTSHVSHTSLVRSNPNSNPTSRAASCTPTPTSSTAASHHGTDVPGHWADRQRASRRRTRPSPSTPSTLSSATGGFGSANPLARGDDALANRARSPSMADSIISHMSSVDDVTHNDSFEEDFSYVPCFTMDQARSTFRDTVLGLEYLHYEGIVHRDIKPANLLWTKEHRVKISDFGVSFFGRPTRDGEQGENASESDETEFDDDVELSKTVGTPAFFAPELCYTDLDTPQPRINDQIDIWSLGVTLYCLIFARIPFLAEDEYQLFRAIAQQDEGDYRADGELVMEDIDDELFDLLRRMLVKDPAERIKLREVKRHPWDLRGNDDVIGWLDDTDPSRRTAGKRIQVDDRELERAVVPISFVERARSAVKKVVGKIQGRHNGSR